MGAHVNRQGEGEVVYSSDRREAAIRIAVPGLVLTETRYEEGERGADLHIHKQHTDSFFVLEGALRYTIGDAPHDLRAGGLAVIPPGVIHGFDNGHPGRSRFLNIHAPNTGFDEYLRKIGDADDKRELSERTDSWDPPADGGRDPGDARLVPDGEGAEAEHLAVRRIALAAGQAVSHVHDEATGCVYVLGGEVTIEAGPDLVELQPGDVAAVGPGEEYQVRTASGCTALHLVAGP
jgi:quercetin dioxygenase-like cupin family protein